MLKKTILMIEAVLMSCIFEFTVIFATTDAVDYIFSLDRSSNNLYEIIESILFACLNIILINLLNRNYDRAAGFAGKRKLISRWTKTVLLIGLVTIFLVSFCLIMDMPSVKQMNSTTLMIEGIASAAAVSLAVYLYIANYHKTKDVGVRIHDLTYQNVTAHQRRYFLLVEEVNDNEKELTLRGMVFGEIKAGDEVCLLSPKEQICRVKIRKMIVDGLPVKNAKNVITSLVFSKDDVPYTIPKLTVVSDVLPYCSKISDGVNNVENPYLCSLLMEYTRLNRDKDYVSLLFYSICHGNYLIAGTVEDKNSVMDIMDVPQNRTDIGFSSVSQTGRTEPMLPIFTSWDSLKNWKDIVNGDKSITLILDFPHIIDIWRNGFAGIVIDPFGPRPFALSKLMIDSLTSSTGYREDFILHNKERDSK